MHIYVDATTLIALGTTDELGLLESFDGTLVVLPAVRDEVTTEPARTALQRLLIRSAVLSTFPGTEADLEGAQEVLGESDWNADVWLIAAVMTHSGSDKGVAIVSDDRRVRTVSRGLGARVTGTLGVVVRAVREERLKRSDAKALVRRLDEHGLHMTAELRERADQLIDDNAA